VAKSKAGAARKDSSAFAGVLKALRARAGLTQAVVAKRSRIPLGTYQQYEQGHREPNWRALLKLARGLRASLGDFEPQAARAAKEA
jgi:transcriptional regulator with XRE-family HTH domain